MRCLALHNQLFLEAMLYSFYRHVYLLAVNSTVGINPIISDLNTPQTSKLGRGTLKSIKLIGMNSQKGTRTKMAEKLNNFKKFERKKVKFQPCS